MNTEAILESGGSSVAASLVVIASSGWFYGYQFQKLKNILLALEFYIIGVSATSGLLVITLGAGPVFRETWEFLDIFSRFVGVPVFCALGYFQITRDLKFSLKLDLLFFAIAFFVTYVFYSVPVLAQTIPMMSVLIGLILIYALIEVAKQSYQCSNVSNGRLAIVTIILLVSIGILIELIPLPSITEHIVFNDEFLNHLSQAIVFPLIFYVYKGLYKCQAQSSYA